MVTILLTGLVVAIAGLVVLWAKPDAEAAVDYSVPLPQQCQPGWKGEVLEKPSIKVCLYRKDLYGTSRLY